LKEQGKQNDIFYLKIIVYDSKSYMKGKVIFNSVTWKLLLENNTQMEFDLVEDLVNKVVSKLLKDIVKMLGVP